MLITQAALLQVIAGQSLLAARTVVVKRSDPERPDLSPSPWHLARIGATRPGANRGGVPPVSRRADATRATDLSWPHAQVGTGRWGVETPHANVLLCGAGAVRGGGVSGVPVQNAAMAVLESTRT